MFIARAICASFIYFMVFRILCAWLLFSETNAFADNTYKWVDSNNESSKENSSEIAQLLEKKNVNHYSSDSSQYDIDRPTSLSSLDLNKQTNTVSIEINNLTNYQTIRNNRGEISIKAKVNPYLADDQQLQLMLDYLPYGEPQRAPSWHLENIDRGSHYFSIDVIKNGKIIASSDPITVYLHRASRK